MRPKTGKGMKRALGVGSALLLSAMIAAAQTHTSLEVSGHQLVLPGPGEIEITVSGNGDDVLLAVNGAHSADRVLR
jgi:hypothetical protein